MIGAIASACAAFTLLAIGVGVIHAANNVDRTAHVLALQLLGTGAAAVLLLLSIALDTPQLLDIALIIAALAAITALVFMSPSQRDTAHRRGDGS